MAHNWWDPKKKQENPHLWRLLVQRYALASAWVSGHVVDAACGYGVGSTILKRVADRVEGFDVDEVAIQTAKEYAHPDIHFSVRDITTDLPVCDWIVSLETIEHIEDYEKFLGLLRDRSRRGVVLSTPIIPTLKNHPGHYRNTTPEDVDAWFRGWQKAYWMNLYEPYKEVLHFPAYYLGVYVREGT